LPILKNQQGNIYKITVSSENNGEISPNGDIVFIQGGNQTFTFTPNTGYEINQVLIDGVNNAAAVSAGSYTFTNVIANHTISVSFIKQYTITVSADANGSISPSTNETVLHGNNSQTFTFTPNIGYEINQVLIDGVNNPTAVSAGSYTFTNVTANHTISVSFIKQYTITVSTGSGGTISPPMNQTVLHGKTGYFTFTPNAGYQINQVLIDGVNNPAAVSSGSYTFSNVTANHTISVSFIKQYTILVSAGANGSMLPSFDQTVTHGSDQTFFFTPDTGYEINQVLVDGVNNPAAISTGSYTFSNVTANHTIAVTFKLKQYTITASAGTGVSAATGSNTYNYGTSATVNCTVQTGYTFDGWYEGSTKVSSSPSYSFTVTAARTLQARATQNTYTITVSAGNNGSISPAANQTVVHGNSQTFTFTPQARYEIDQVLVDGVNNPTAVANHSYTFSNVTANHSVAVSFKQSCLPHLVAQVWDDVLLVNNNPSTNGGYTFVSYQWQKNGVTIAGETSGSLYFGNGNLDANAEYSVLLIATNGQQLQSCPVRLQAGNYGLRSYPNPTSGIVTIEHASIQAGDKIEVFNSYGQLMQQSSAEKNQTTLDLSSLPRGTYILKINNRQAKVIKN
jgi:uncharacterized repeat protein (TIGR02543 family)